ncbi:uncharacterized protein LOC112048353 [Bicyclus anynana]|uniref:Uncharacterized protein LOC112048353 n=1 Tax=Bicyclus anynana TaxID=110368 RepID=A0A6J1N9D9_BICAN|nr:uncharacterized protein LOC112048353 [Bicyclus anynana]
MIRKQEMLSTTQETATLECANFYHNYLAFLCYIQDENYFIGKRVLNNNKRLLKSLVLATHAIDRIAVEMYTPEEMRWQKTLLGHTFTMSRESCVGDCESSTKAVVSAFKSWLQAHEEAQVMFASALVVVGLWWLVKTVLALLINLVCPILVVVLAVVCVPQLRVPLLGQNYPLLANILRSILLKLAENIKV